MAGSPSVSGMKFLARELYVRCLDPVNHELAAVYTAFFGARSAAPRTMKQIFVYGTLMHDGVNADLLARRRDAKLLGPAWCRGTIYDLGEFPALVVGGRRWVAGELYRSDSMEEILKSLDPMEEEAGFARALVGLRWKLGETEAWAYVVGAPPAGATLIESGSYKARIRELRRGGGAA